MSNKPIQSGEGKLSSKEKMKGKKKCDFPCISTKSKDKLEPNLPLLLEQRK